MAGLSKFTSAFIFTALFAVLILLFSIFFLNQTNPASIQNDTYGLSAAASSMNSSLNAYSDLSTSIQTTLASSTPSPLQFVFLIFKGAFDIPYAFMLTFGNLFSVLTTMIYNMGGGGWGGAIALAMGVMLSVWIVTMVLLIVRTIRTGETER